MNKEQFLKTLRHSLRRFDKREVEQVINYYEEMISDKMERGEREESIIRELGDIKTITREVQLDLLTTRVESAEKNIEKTSNSFFIILMLFASPALLPLGIALFVLFFTILIVSAALMVSFLATTIGLIISLIPAIVIMAANPAEAVLGAGIILLLAGIFGLLTILFYNLTKQILNSIVKFATKIAKKANKKEIKK